METLQRLVAEAFPAPVIELPIRDGNEYQRKLRLQGQLVIELPIRDGNLSFSSVIHSFLYSY